MRIVLIGASVRPWIASCLAAETTPVAWDLFADWDSEKMINGCELPGSRLTKIRCYDDVLSHDLASLGDAAVLCGGAELNDDLTSYVGQQLPILGPSPTALSQLSQPLNWLNYLGAAGVRVPPSQLTAPAGPPGQWLTKTASSCGGQGIGPMPLRRIEKKTSPPNRRSQQLYYQQRISGRSLSALLVSIINNSSTHLLGCSEQIFAAEAPFCYAGSLLPATLPECVTAQVRRIGSMLAKHYALIGVWGIDFLVDAKNQVWPVDVNPRLTASATLYENKVCRTTELRSVIDLHREACLQADGLAIDPRMLSQPIMAEGKLVLFNRSDKPIAIDAPTFQSLAKRHDSAFYFSQQHGVTYNDIPNQGQKISVGHPVLTLRARATTRSGVINLLRQHTRECQRQLQIGESDKFASIAD